MNDLSLTYGVNMTALRHRDAKPMTMMCQSCDVNLQGLPKGAIAMGKGFGIGSAVGGGNVTVAHQLVFIGD